MLRQDQRLNVPKHMHKSCPLCNVEIKNDGQFMISDINHIVNYFFNIL